MIKYYAPIAEVYDFLGKFITKGMKVLELGPGIFLFHMQLIFVVG